MNAGTAATATGSTAAVAAILVVDTAAACEPVGGVPPIVAAVRAVADAVAPALIVVAVAEGYRAAVGDLACLVSADIAVVPAPEGIPHGIGSALEYLALQSISSVLIHDWRHPLTPAEVVDRVLAGLAAGHRIVVPAIAVTDSVKQIDEDGAVVATVDRELLQDVQYPRGFSAATLVDLIERGGDPLATALEAGVSVTVVDGHADARRFDLPVDAAFLEAVMACRR